MFWLIGVYEEEYIFNNLKLCLLFWSCWASNAIPGMAPFGKPPEFFLYYVGFFWTSLLLGLLGSTLILCFDW